MTEVCLDHSINVQHSKLKLRSFENKCKTSSLVTDNCVITTITLIHNPAILEKMSSVCDSAHKH